MLILIKVRGIDCVVEKVNKQQVVVTVVQCRLRPFSNINTGIRDARPIREEFVLIPEEVAKSIRMSAGKLIPEEVAKSTGVSGKY
jgi:hypothetical protein